jgi:glycosyltransferase involved in cell wall biosynthesis
MVANIPSVMLMYLGRRGAMVRFAREASEALARSSEIQGCIMVSRQTEGFVSTAETGQDIIGVNTFSSALGALTSLSNLVHIRRTLKAEITRRKVEVLIDLMPHVWSPALCKTVQRAGARYAAIAHDAMPHPGDITGYASRWANRSLKTSDCILVLSNSTGRRLRTSGMTGVDRIKPLIHPDLNYITGVRRRWDGMRPLRLLFLGRILPYKGLPIFVEVAERLISMRVPIEVGVFGEGDLGQCSNRLTALGASVVNRWLSESEVAAALAAYDLMVLSHIEASQSGVIAAAYGAGMPVVVTPVGGLPEQVEDGTTGLVAGAVTVAAIAEAVVRVATNPELYRTLVDGIELSRNNRSMHAFLVAAVNAALDRGDNVRYYTPNPLKSKDSGVL